jgi:glycosyltransferase involved in cell wall biosynthesis
VTGLPAKPGDWRGVAAAVLELLGDPCRSAAMGQAGRARVERLFEVGAYARRIEEIYEEIAGVATKEAA